MARHRLWEAVRRAWGGILGIGDIQGFRAELVVAADGAGIAAFRDMKAFLPAPLLNFAVRHPIRCNEDLKPGKATRLLGEWGRQPWGGAEQPSHPCEGRPSTRKPS